MPTFESKFGICDEVTCPFVDGPRMIIEGPCFHKNRPPTYLLSEYSLWIREDQLSAYVPPAQKPAEPTKPRFDVGDEVWCGNQYCTVLASVMIGRDWAYTVGCYAPVYGDPDPVAWAYEDSLSNGPPEDCDGESN